MQPGKKLLTMLLPTCLALMAMLMVACGGGGGTSIATPTAAAKAPASQQVDRVALGTSDLATFDPAVATDLYSAEAIYAVFTGMVQLNDKLEVKPQLASSWTSSGSSDCATISGFPATRSQRPSVRAAQTIRRRPRSPPGPADRKAD